MFLFGLAIGSFLNVVILRARFGKSLGGRSKCFSCNHRLGIWDLIPVFSFMILGGRCRYCKSRISIQYILVEFLTGALFVLSFLHSYSVSPLYFAVWDFVSLAIISSALIVVFVYDLKHKIIPDGAVIIVGIMALFRIFVLYIGGVGGENLIFEFIAGHIAALPFFLLWFLSRGKWMGFGDVKLMLPLGWLVGWQLFLPSIALAFWLGALFVIIIKIYQKVFAPIFPALIKKLPDLHLKSEVPFAPFLIISALISLFFGSVVTGAMSIFLR